jgi:hypothetical protein
VHETSHSSGIGVSHLQEVVSLLDIGQLVGYDRGQTIFEQNMDADSFGILCSGHLNFFFKNPYHTCPQSRDINAIPPTNS